MTTNTAQLLKDKDWVFAQSQSPTLWGKILTEFIAVGLVSAALFGIVMSTYDFSLINALHLAGKMIMLLWGPMAICLPSLFVFSVIRGSKIKFGQLVYLALGSLATTGIVLLSLTPIVWFFIWTSDSLLVVQTVEVIAISVTLIFGLFFLGKSFVYLKKAVQNNQIKSASALDILCLWFILLVTVIIQMSDKLGPWYR